MPHRVAAGGALVGSIAVIAALIAGPSVPGAGGSPLLEYKNLGRGDGQANLLSAPPPILSVRDKLTLGPTQQLFTVQAPRPAYWRVIALDWFTNDNAWGINQAAEENIAKLRAPDDLPRRFRSTSSSTSPRWIRTGCRPRTARLRSTSPRPATSPTRSRCSSTRATS